MDSTNTEIETKDEEYLCQKCGAVSSFSAVSNIVCKNCGWRIFRKQQTDKIIRIKAV